MAHVMIDASAKAAGKKLASLMKWKHAETMGRLYFFWHDSQSCEVIICSENDVCTWMDIKEKFAKAICSAMVECGFLIQQRDAQNNEKFIIVGNEKHIKAIQNKKEANKINGKSGGRPKSSDNNPSLTHVGLPWVSENNPPSAAWVSKNNPCSVLSCSELSCSEHKKKEVRKTVPAGEESLPLGMEDNSSLQSPGSRVFDTYSQEFQQRYDVTPKRNATVNSQALNLAKRLGVDDACEVVRFYLKHNDGYYLKNQHPLGLCLAQAESLFTQWRRGRAVTGNDVRQFEKTDHVRSQLARIESGEL